MRPAAATALPLGPAVASPVGRPDAPAAPARGWLEFASYLARKYAITGDLLGGPEPEGRPDAEKQLRDLWEITDLSANDFADEVASFYDLPRIHLPALIAASPLSGRFSPRFL